MHKAAVESKAMQLKRKQKMGISLKRNTSINLSFSQLHNFNFFII